MGKALIGELSCTRTGLAASVEFGTKDKRSSVVELN